MACSVWASALLSILLVRGEASDCGSLILSVDPCNQGQSVAVNACVMVGNSLAIVCNVQDTSATWISPDFTPAIISKNDPMTTKLNDMVEFNFMNQTPSCLLSNATIDNVQSSLDGLDLSCRTNFQDRSHANISIVVIDDGIASVKQIAIDLTTDEKHVDLEVFDHQDCQFFVYLISEGLCSQQDDSANIAMLEPPTVLKRISVNSFSELCVSACTEEEVCICQEIDLDGFTVTRSQELPKETSYSVILSFSHNVLNESVEVSPGRNGASCIANKQTSKQVMLNCSDLSNSTSYSVTVQGKASLNDIETGYQYTEFAVSLDFTTAARMNNATVDDNGLSGGAIAGIVVSTIFVLIIAVYVVIGPVFLLVIYGIKRCTEKDGISSKDTDSNGTSSEDIDSSIVGKQLFLSYEHDVPDVDNFVRELKEDLEQRGFTVLMDEDIPAGSDWDNWIKIARNSCEGLIAIITNNYTKSDTCIEELKWAQGRKKIFPVVLEEQVDTIKNKSPRGVMTILQSINWVYLRPNMDNQKYSRSLDHLVSRVTASGIKPVALKATVAHPNESPCAVGKQLFLSYEHEPDIDGFVWEMKQYLERRGFTVVMGVYVHHSQGTQWASLATEAIDDCEGFIAVITNSYTKSRYRNIELNNAHGNERKIFPVVHKDVDHSQPNDAYWKKFVIEEVTFDPDAANYDFSQTFAPLEYTVAANGIQPAALEATDLDPDEG